MACPTPGNGQAATHIDRHGRATGLAVLARRIGCVTRRPTYWSMNGKEVGTNAKESLDMTHSTLRPIPVDPVAGRVSAGAEVPRQHGHRARIRARLPAVSPVVWLTSERVTQQALSLILFAVLAPILGPRPYGLFAIVMVFVGFCEWILLEGAVEALVTVDDLDHLHTTVANLTSGLLALVFGLAISALAPAIAAALHDAEIRNVMWALAPYAGVVIAVGSADRGAASVAEIQTIGHSLDSRTHDRRCVRYRACGGGRRSLGVGAAGAGAADRRTRDWMDRRAGSRSASPGRLRISANSVRSP